MPARAGLRPLTLLVLLLAVMPPPAFCMFDSLVGRDTRERITWTPLQNQWLPLHEATIK